MSFAINPRFKNLIPPLTADEYRDLEQNILADGCRDPLVTWNGTLIDGHNRHDICTRHGLEFATIEMEFDSESDADIWIIRNQFGRRNLTPFVRGELALKLKPLLAEKAKANCSAGGGDKKSGSQNSVDPIVPVDTQKELAKAAGMSHDTMHKIGVIAEKASEPIKQALRAGETTINAEYKRLTNFVTKNSVENEWYTPPRYIEAARRVLGEIDLDPASSVMAQETVKATTFYTAADDGLEQEWSGRVWLNPPYSSDLIDKFCKKLASSLADGSVTAAILLVNNATDATWFYEISEHASAVCNVKGRISFLDETGEPRNRPLQGQVFLYFGQDVESFCEEFAGFGRLFLGTAFISAVA